MKLLIASDSYKGSLSTLQVAASIKEGILKVFSDAQIDFIPIADGGEGTVEVLITSLGGQYYFKQVMGPNGNTVEAKYGILENNTAVIEMAAASGLTLVQETEKDIMNATSYGTGQLIQAVLDQGCRKIYLGIGGSATNDGGVGIAKALGVRFLDRYGEEIGLGAGTLKDLNDIDMSGIDKRIFETEICVMCDVTNPLIGPNGAANVYGPQKGATLEQIARLDENLLHLSILIQKNLHKELAWIPGAGAAGGAGMGLMAFLNAEIVHGIEAVMDVSEIDKRIKWSDMVITGEGKIDSQSVCGKVIDGLANRAKKYKKPVIAIAGSIGTDISMVYEKGIDTIEAAVCRPMELSLAMEHASDYVSDAAERVMRSVRIGIELQVADTALHIDTETDKQIT
ncbi:glycerate kinase [Lachnotalea glycerini]|uniref:Glycerate kinase n=1 Tax=Lachnotalea glycerini TaxID=1763509 RepID=A0A255IHG9_9FIRM|nr:glycerate kinase [Lachnotalea glycerini]PXV91622.1 glycerate kinase [Lachnotalea glycerini]RDY28452.1 glycerate kinase [Lachnotalea glycerini]